MRKRERNKREGEPSSFWRFPRSRVAPYHTDISHVIAVCTALYGRKNEVGLYSGSDKTDGAEGGAKYRNHHLRMTHSLDLKQIAEAKCVAHDDFTKGTNRY